MKAKSILTLCFACAITALALALAVASAWQRAGSDIDRWLLSCAAAASVLAVHWLPGLLRRFALFVWPVWGICFLCAIWGHVWFFTSTGQSAVQNRAAASAPMQVLREQQETLETALRANKARSAATVASMLARTTDPTQRLALEIELVEARRANEMRAQLVTLSVQTAVTAVTDPVTGQVMALTGVSAEVIGLVMNIGMATLLEVLGMLLWLEVWRTGTRLEAEQVMDLPRHGLLEIDRLRNAVESGDCDATVAGIRKFLACGQTKAMQLRRELMQIAAPVQGEAS